MKMKVILLFASFTLCHMAQAREFGAVFGFNYTEKKTSTNVSSESEVGFQGGVQYYHPLDMLHENLYLRTGGVITQRVSEFGIFEVDLLYLDIPATIEFRVNNKVALFTGLQFAILMADECSPNCNVDNPDKIIFGFPFGVNIMFTPEMGVDLYYQVGLSDMYSDVEWSDTLGAQFIYKFDL